MKKKILVPIISIVVLAAVLFLPIPQGSYDDGGTRDYNALTYKIVRWNKITVELDENDQPIHNTYAKRLCFGIPTTKKALTNCGKLKWKVNRILKNHRTHF